MADRFWVGGAGTWNTTSTTNWSATSGGPGGASVPTAADSVFFDQAATYTVTMTGALLCLDFTVSAGTVTFATGTTPTLAVSGSMSLVSATIWNSTGTITFNSNTARTISAAGTTINGAITFNNAAGSWTLQSNLTLGATRALTLTNGTFDANGKTIVASGITVTTGSATVRNLTTTLNVTHTSGTLTLGSAVTVGNYTLTAGSLILDYDLTCTIFSSAAANSRSISTSQASGSIFITGNNATVLDVTNINNFAMAGLIKFVSTYTGSTGTRTFVYGSTGTPNYTFNILGMGVSVNTANATSGFVIQSTATDTVAFTGSFEDFNLTGFSGTLANTARTLYGSLTIPTTVTLTAGTNATTMAGITGATPVVETIATNGKSIPFPITINNSIAGFSYQLVDGITFTPAVTTNILTLTAGVLDLNNQTVTAYALNSNSTNTRSIAFGASGKIILTGNATTTLIDFGTNVTAFTYTGTPFIYCNYSGATGARQISFGPTGATATNTFDLSIGTTGTGIVIAPSTDTLQLTGAYDNVNLTGLTNTVSANTRTIYGNLVIPATGGTFSTGVAVTTLSGDGTTVNTNGRSLGFPIAVATTTSVALTANVNLTTSFTLTSGTIQLSNNTITTTALVSSGTNARSIDFSTSGKVILTGSSTTVLDLATATNFSYQGTPYIHSNYTGATGTRTFNFGATAGHSATNTFDVSIGTSGTGLIISPATDSISLTGGFFNFNLTGITQTLPNATRTIYGNLVIPATGGTLSPGASATTLAGLSAQTLNTNNRSIPFPIIYNGTANLALSGNTTFSGNAFTLTSGNLLLNNFTLTAVSLVSDSSSVRSIDFGTTGRILVTGSATTVVNFATATNFTYSGTPYIFSNYSGATGTRTINFGGTAGATDDNVFNLVTSTSGTGIVIGTTATDTVSATGNYRDLVLTGLAGTFANAVRTIRGNVTIPASGGTLTAGTSATTLAPAITVATITTNGRVIDFPLAVQGDIQLAGALTLGTTRTLTLTQGNIDLNNNTLSANAFSSSNTNTRGLLFGNTGSMSLVGNSATIWNTTIGTNFLWTGNLQVNSTYTGATGTRTVNFGTLTEQYAPNVKVTTGTAGFNVGVTTDTLALTGTMGTLNLTGFTSTLSNTARTIYGNLIIPATGGTLTAGTSATTLAATTSYEKEIRVNGRTLDFPITINGVGGLWRLQTAFVIGATRVFTLSDGTFDVNNQTLTLGSSANLTISTGNVTLQNTGNTAYTTTVPVVHASGTLNLATNLTTTNTYTLSSGNLSLYNSVLDIGTFSSSNTSTRLIDFGTGKIVVRNTTTATVWNTSTLTGLSIAGNPLVEFTGGGTGVTKTINTGSATEALAINMSLLETTGTASYTFAASSTVKNLIINGSQTVSSTNSITIYGNYTYSNTNGNTTFTAGTGSWTFGATTGDYIITPGTPTYDFPWVFGTATSTATWTLNGNLTTASKAVTVTGGTLSLSSYRLTTAALNSNNSNTRTIDFGTGKIVLNTSVTATIWNTTTATNLTLTGSRLVETGGGGSAVTKTITTGTLPESQALNLSLLETGGTATYTITTGASLNNLIVNGVQTVNNTAITIYGNFTHLTANGTTTFTAGTNAWTFGATSGTYNLNSITGFTYDFPWTFNGVGATWALSGNLTLGATRQLTLTNGTFDFNNKTVSAAGITVLTGSPTVISTGSSAVTTALPITHTNGTLSLIQDIATTGTYTLTAGNLSLGSSTLEVGTFSSSNSNTRAIDFGTGKLIVKTTSGGTVWNTSTGGNLTVAGSRLVEFTGGGTGVTKTINSSGLVENSSLDFSLVESSGTVTYTLSVNSIVRNLTLNGSQNVTNTAITLYGNLNHSNNAGTTVVASGTNSWTLGATSGIQTINTPASSLASGLASIFLNGSSYTSTPANAAFSFGTGDFTVETWINFNSATSQGRLITNRAIDGGLAGTWSWSVRPASISFTEVIAGEPGLSVNLASPMLVGQWYHVSVVRSSSTITFYINGISVGSGTTTANYSATNQSLLVGFVGDTVNPSYVNGYISNLRIVKGTAVYTGNFTPPALSNLATSGAGSVAAYPSTANVNTTFGASATSYLAFQSFTGLLDNSSNAFTINIGAGSAPIIPTQPVVIYDWPWIFNGVGSTVLLQTSFAVSHIRSTTLTNGTLDLNGYTFSTGSLTNTVGTQTLTADGGTLMITGSGATTVNITSPSSLTSNTGSATGNIRMISSSAKTFAGAGVNLSGFVLNQAGIGALTVSGSNTFEDLQSSISTFANATVTFTTSTTTTFNRFTASGTATYRLTINSSTVDTPATLYSPLGVTDMVTGSDYITVRDIAFTPFTTDGTDYMRWHIGSNSVILNSTGALGQTYLAGSTPKVYVLESGTTWVVPSDFNSSNNIVHLIGAGGSSQSTANGGRAGGGGGYSRLDNLNIRDGQQISYSVPAGGQPNGTQPGPTVFSIYSAGSGQNGTTGVAAAAGGVGTTYNGGAAGRRFTTTTAYTGPGGGGAAGPLGPGAAGGRITVDLASASARSGAGGGAGDGGAAGSSSPSTGLAVAGGNNILGTGGGTSSASGTQSGGGSGGASTATSGGDGGSGFGILSSLGAGGGGGGGGTSTTASFPGGAGGKYGGGAGGPGFNGTQAAAGSAGGQGVVIIQYLPVTPKFMGWFN